MKIDARGWLFQIRDSRESDPTWVEIRGINSFEDDPNANGETTETTTFASGGEYEGEAMQRGGALSIEGFMEYEDDDETVRDPGQALVDRIGTKVSRESHADIRFRHDSHTEWTNWTVYNEPGGKGGGNNDKTSWSASLTRSGAAWVTDLDGNLVEDDDAEGGTG